jgi:metallo-beta-lactamase family protein
VLIPAFAVDRTAVLLAALKDLMAHGQVPRVPVFVDSPMALAALDVYRQAIREGSADMRFQPDGDPFDPGTLHVARTVAESVELNHPTRPCVILSAAGMATGGRVVQHLAGLAPDPRNLILLAGYQAVGTRGRALLDGATTVNAHGRYIAVRAEVAGLDEFSCHADSTQTVPWLRTAPHPPDICVAVHGEPAASAALVRRISEELGWCAVAPRMNEKVRA